MHGMYGLVVMLILTYVGVAIGAVNMGTLFTWWVWTVGHLMFGAVLGMVVLAAPRRTAAAVPAQLPQEQAPRRVA